MIFFIFYDEYVFSVSRPWSQRFRTAVNGVIGVFILLVLPDLWCNRV